MKKSEKVIGGFCLLFFLTTIISLSQQNEILKDPIPVPPDSGMIIDDNPLVDQNPPISPPWNSRHSRKYCGMVAGDYDADGYHEIAFDFGSLGIWIYDPNAATAWNKISDDNPVWMIAAGFGYHNNDKLVVSWDSSHLPLGSWWDGYIGYPGIWRGISSKTIDYAYDAGDVGSGEGTELVVQYDGYGIYVYEYTYFGIHGGFEIYNISTTEAEGFTAQFGGTYYFLHAFSDGTKYYYCSSGYPSTNWMIFNSASLDVDNSIAADVNGRPDEVIADIIDQLWLYDPDVNTWTRLNYNQVCKMYVVAYDTLDEQYEILVNFCSVAGLWGFDPDVTTAGVRLSWNQPEHVLGADFRTTADGGNNGEEALADFGSLGVWIQLQWTGSWTRLNWNNPQAMIKANLDADPEMEIVFDFGTLGVWVWDGAGSGTGTWTKINYNDPETPKK